MRKIREVLRLKFELDLSVRQISMSTQVSRPSVTDYLRRFAMSGLSWPLPAELADAVLLVARGDESANQNAKSGCQQKDGNCAGRGTQGQAVKLLQYRRAKILQGTECSRCHQEKAKTQPHRADTKKRERAMHRRTRSGGSGRYFELVAKQPECCQRRERHQPGGNRRHLPPRQCRNAGQEHRRQRPSEIARDAVDRERMTQVGFRDLVIQDGEIGRMQHAIAQPRQRGNRKQIAQCMRKQPQPQTGDQETAHAEQQHPQGPESIHGKSRQRLSDTGDHKKDRHSKTDPREIKTESRHQPRKQRRKQQMEEMRCAMRQADHRNDRSIALNRRIDCCADTTHGCMTKNPKPQKKPKKKTVIARGLRVIARLPRVKR